MAKMKGEHLKKFMSKYGDEEMKRDMEKDENYEGHEHDETEEEEEVEEDALKKYKAKKGM